MSTSTAAAARDSRGASLGQQVITSASPLMGRIRSSTAAGLERGPDKRIELQAMTENRQVSTGVEPAKAHDRTAVRPRSPATTARGHWRHDAVVLVVLHKSPPPASRVSRRILLLCSSALPLPLLVLLRLRPFRCVPVNPNYLPTSTVEQPGSASPSETAAAPNLRRAINHCPTPLPGSRALP